MTQIAKSIILITGGASGIGKIMGRKCLQRGASHLVIWDINSRSLNQTITEFTSEGFSAHGFIVDVSDADAVHQTASQVCAEIGVPDILINNAGIVVGSMFHEHSYQDIQRTIGINTTAPMLVTKAFMEGIIGRGSGHVVNIASAAAMTPNPRMSVYAASKWAMLGWSESLRLEFEQQSKDMHVTTVTPSYIDTGMFAGVKAPFLTPILDPEEISEAIVQAILTNKILLRKPAVVHLLPILRGILPTRLFDLIAGRVFNVYSSMANFTGRPEKTERTETEQVNL